RVTANHAGDWAVSALSAGALGAAGQPFPFEGNLQDSQGCRSQESGSVLDYGWKKRSDIQAIEETSILQGL
ncbi:MAG TPA: hypothetical protein VJQ59_06135, partial [Candidatus Sulfotelmatobacter sp.]|nr:hypothetical protein [Candidatus Sulfotelmatobacter sp.]